ncbi:MAG: alanine racemase, partial [Phenylobacterium sp.]
MAELAATRLTIDLGALTHNHGVLRREAAGAEVAPVLKADGYGLGAGAIGARLWDDGARTFFVARLSEGEALRAALGPVRPATIYVLDGFTAGSGARLAASDLRPALSTLPQVSAAQAWA